MLHARVSTEPASAGHPALIFVHGLNVSSLTMLPTARLLARSYPVYAPDLPGCGESQKPAHALTVPELADALVAWMQAIGLERAVLIGNSMGCQVAVDCAARHPERVERLVLIGPTVDPQGRPLIRLLGRWLLDGHREPLALRLTLLRDYLGLRPLPAIQTLRSMMADHIEEKLPAARVPTLIVRGGRDPIAPQRWAEEATRLLPDGRLVVIPGAPHTTQFSAPLECARVMRPFLLDVASACTAAVSARHRQRTVGGESFASMAAGSTGATPGG